jgi:hypothetical protein
MPEGVRSMEGLDHTVDECGSEQSARCDVDWNGGSDFTDLCLTYVFSGDGLGCDTQNRRGT